MTNPTGNWRTRPVFISSTFRDMHAERDWLRTRVFPRLQDALRPRRHHLAPIDLRLGVEAAPAGTEAARELLILKVCLDEIRRSRPFLLVVMGDRYGWVPPESSIAAAAREQNFETSPAGKSVTALEIEFGVSQDDATERRSLFFFRQPLPYELMTSAQRATYSDAHAPDPEVRAGSAKLAALKDWLRLDPEFGPRVFDYRAGWDATAGKVTNLEAFGELVFEQLWAALDAETRSFVTEAPPTWQEQERAALAEFVEHRSRVFVGREDIVGGLLDIARSQAAEDPPGLGTWGVCLTGSPGSGKSAVISQLYRHLEQDASILLLANAAGGTQRGAIVDAMLRRWIDELATTAGTATPLGETASPDEVEGAFHALLQHVSATRRVVVLIDALDQFEPTPRGRHLTWFKATKWPSNARLITTSVPCPAADDLSQWAGIEELELPPITAADATEIGQRIWSHYHRLLNPAVTRVLVGKRLTDGPSAFGNPLWLTLAFEQLNLLDADDFARAEREFSGSPTERMAALLIDTARRMPPDIEGLYGWLLAENEKSFGTAQARGFVAAVALSRSGWRESDLSVLVPRLGRLLSSGLAVPELDSLGVAALRRGFRAHMVRRGEYGQLDFFHAQMRGAMLKSCASDPELRRALHATISDVLETLPGDDALETFLKDDPHFAGQGHLVAEHLRKDPLVRLERMNHLIGERNALRAARFFGTFLSWGEMTTEREGPTWALVEWIAEGETSTGENANLRWVISWLEAPGLQVDELLRLASNFETVLFLRLENYVSTNARLALINAIANTRHRLTLMDPSNLRWQRDELSTQSLVGAMLLKKGNVTAASSVYGTSVAIARRLASADSHNADLLRDLSERQMEVGVALQRLGDLAGALAAYRESLLLRERLASLEPFSSARQSDWALVRVRIGDVLRSQDDLAGALEAYRESLVVHERIMAAQPVDEMLRFGEAIARYHWLECQDRIGGVMEAQGQLAGALDAYQEALAVRERLISNDSSELNWSELAANKDRIGDVLGAQGNLAQASRAYHESLAVRERLASSEPSHGGWQRDLFESYSRLAELVRKGGADSDDELYWWRRAERQLTASVEGGFAKPQDNERLQLVRETIALAIEERQAEATLAEATAQYRDAVYTLIVTCLDLACEQESGITDEDRDWLREAHNRLSLMKQSGAVKADDSEFLETTGARAARLSAIRRPFAPPGRVALPPSLLTERDALSETAQRSFSQGNWEAAVTGYQHLLEQNGITLTDAAPRIALALLNAFGTAPRVHEQIQALILRLDAAGEPELADHLRRQLVGRESSSAPVIGRSRWKFW